MILRKMTKLIMFAPESSQVTCREAKNEKKWLWARLTLVIDVEDNDLEIDKIYFQRRASSSKYMTRKLGVCTGTLLTHEIRQII